jgi:hypothetical protein
MRRVIEILSIFAFCGLLAALWGVVAVLTVSGAEPPVAASDTGKTPIVLDLNPPVLSAPLENETLNDSPDLADEKSNAEGASASSRPKTPTEAKPAAPAEKPKETPTKAVKADKKSEPTATPAAKAEQTDKTEKADAAKNAGGEVAPQPPKEAAPPAPLSPEMTTLRDSVRRTLASYAEESFNTRENTAASILQVCLAYGCDAEVRRDVANGQRLNGITCLCWNYPCAGYELLGVSGDWIAPRIGHGYQEYPGQLLAVLAISRVPREYPIRVGDDVRKVSDLVEYEKRDCHAGGDLSFKLIGLSRYVPSDETWKNDLDEPWSLSRMIREELAARGDEASCGGTHRLLALSYAIDCRLKRGEPIDGQFLRAQKYVSEFCNYAMELQNADGSWHPRFFAYRGQGGTVVEQLHSTGHILRWLVFSLPEDQLQDPRIVRAVARVNSLLADGRYRGRSLSAASELEIAARMNAIHALMLYDQRVFQPRDEAPKPEGEKKGEVAAKPAAWAK